MSGMMASGLGELLLLLLALNSAGVPLPPVPPLELIKQNAGGSLPLWLLARAGSGAVRSPPPAVAVPAQPAPPAPRP